MQDLLATHNILQLEDECNEYQKKQKLPQLLKEIGCENGAKIIVFTITVSDALTCAASAKPMEKNAVLSAILTLVAAVRGPALAPSLQAVTTTAISLDSATIFGSTVPEQTGIDVFLTLPAAKTTIRSLNPPPFLHLAVAHLHQEHGQGQGTGAADDQPVLP